MRSLWTVPLTIASVVAAALALAAPASAARIRECGNMPSQVVYNLTSRVVTCTEARKVDKAWNSKTRVRGLTCRYKDTGYESGDIRCTGSGGRVVRWQTGV